MAQALAGITLDFITPEDMVMNAASRTRHRLLSLREQLQDRLRRVHIDRSRQAQPLSADFAEQAVERENDQVLDGIDDATSAAIAQLDVALEQLKAGRYGLCSDCGAKIDSARLRALPQATVCVRCASERERAG